MRHYDPDYLAAIRRRIRWTLQYLRGEMPELRGHDKANTPSTRLGGALIGAGAAALLAALLVVSAAGEGMHHRADSPSQIH